MAGRSLPVPARRRPAGPRSAVGPPPRHRRRVLTLSAGYGLLDDDLHRLAIRLAGVLDTGKRMPFADTMCAPPGRSGGGAPRRTSS